MVENCAANSRTFTVPVDLAADCGLEGGFAEPGLDEGCCAGSPSLSDFLEPPDGGLKIEQSNNVWKGTFIIIFTT